MLPLLYIVLEESGTICGIDTTQDMKTILRRFENEGDEFLTITLPSFARDLYRALADEKVTPDLFLPFGRLKGCKLPKFLGGFLSNIFDPDSGDMLDIASESTLAVDSIRSLVQISGLLGKLHDQASPKRTAAAMHRYISNDARVGEYDRVSINKRLGELDFGDFSISDLRISLWMYFGDFLNDLERVIANGDVVPSHGPGAVVEKLRGNAKWRQPAWSERLEEVFPFSRWAFNSYLNYLDSLDADQVAEPGAELPVKVISVPKTQKTPRIIAVEPVSMQYMQQALRNAFERTLERHSTAYALIGYKSQIPNQNMALQGSLDGSLATLDLSDASDLVSNDLVCYLLNEWPHFLEAIQATRSQTAIVNLGNGEKTLVSLNKFASMGSALCFPIEALVFATIVLTGVRKESISHGGKASLKEVLPMVRVYGDDIIVPVNCAQSVVALLEACGLKVNTNKSFWTGRFRESCGKEYWNGHNVSYTKVRFQLPTLSKSLDRDVDSTVHTVALRNNFWNQGWFRVVEFLDKCLDKRLNGVYPCISPTSSALGRFSFEDLTVDRTDIWQQRPMVRAYTVNVNPPESFLDGYGALMKCLTKTSELPNPDVRHLLRGGRPAALRIKLQYVPV